MMSSKITTWHERSDEVVVESSTLPARCPVFKIEYSKPLPQPKKGRALSSFLSDWEGDQEKSADLKEARAWLGEEVSKTSAGETLKTLRLKKGLSQSQLAALMKTSQPHIVRIEKGRDTITFETLCKLSEALDEDYNTIGAAIKLQASLNSNGID
ncbi:transcriptional regulator, y4mF family [compost metagenome]